MTSANVDLASHSSQVIYHDGFNSLNIPDTTIEFRSDSTPVVNSVSPPFGDIFGGYTITLSGDNLNINSQAEVKIDGVTCTIVSIDVSNIVCTVQQKDSNSKEDSFSVIVGGKTALVKQRFTYALRWSDPRTWGTDLPPVDGDLVYVPEGMTLLVDEDTPLLEGIIVKKGGTLLFGNESDVKVRAQFISVKGGSFIAGTQ